MIKIAIRMTLVTLLLCGVIYPLAVTAVAQLLFPHQANGSMVTDDKGREVGSELIGQRFTKAGYLHARPSAAGDGWDATSSGGTNLAVTSKKLQAEARDIAGAYRKENGLLDEAEIPADAVSRSASGLDPEVSPENAELQVPRIARARGVTIERVRAVVGQYTSGRDLGVFGEPRVNVLLVNLALDRTFGATLAR
jgi:K+-transporting ATPase ATPase C chain